MKTSRFGHVLAIALGVSLVSAGMFFAFSKKIIPVAEASQACPFSDGDGGAPGIQVTASVAIAAVPTLGDYYDCTASDVTINSGVTVTLNTDTTAGTYAEIHFTNFTVESGASVRSDSKGCVGTVTDGFGPNTSTNVCTSEGAGVGVSGGYDGQGAGGAGHGGHGGASTLAGGSPYGSSTAPALFGASGGAQVGRGHAGGVGGGVVRLDVSSTLTQNGVISANGGNGIYEYWGSSGAGAGGSVYISTGTYTGSGTFQAMGGLGGYGVGGYPTNGGDGGGGMVAITYTNAHTFTTTDFDVSQGGVSGVKGTVYTKNTSANTVSIFHGFRYSDAAMSATSWTTDALATNQYCASDATSVSITAATVVLTGTFDCSGAAADVSFVSSSSVSMSGFHYTGAAQQFLNISGAAAVSLASSTVVASNVNWGTIASLAVDATSSINANSKGCVGTILNGYGPSGTGTTCVVSGYGVGGNAVNDGWTAAGSGHGGRGDAGNSTAGATYDSPTAPVFFGASGGAHTGRSDAGGTGGGIVHIDISGDLTFSGSTPNATITANGGNGASNTWGAGGGGAGGSIALTIGGNYTGTFGGSSGVFRAKGGDGGYANGSAGGGGGRITIVYTGGSHASVAGDFDVSSASSGAKGTVYVKNTTTNAVKIFHGFDYGNNNASYSVSSWTVDASATNQYCASGATTPSVTAPTMTWSGTFVCGVATDFSLSSSGSIAFTNFTYTANNQKFLNVTGGGTLTLVNSTVNANANWVSMGNMSIDSASMINANGYGCAGTLLAGYAPTGTRTCTADATGAGGSGGYDGTASGGGGHGGAGDAGVAVAGATYDSATIPVLFGASGGAHLGRNIIGGSGGGIVRIDSTGTFTNDGTIRANGNNGLVNSGYSGGGAGGAIFITVNGYACTGTPTIRALGGSTGSNGGGGGGRVRIEYQGSDTCSAQPLSTLTAAVVVAGSSGGAVGTFQQANMNPPPTVTDVSHSPSSPSQTDAVTLSGTATDGGGVTSIKIYLDGTAPGNLKKTCTSSPTSPASCSVNIGALSYGSHTTTIRASDGSGSTDGTETFTVGGATQNGSTTFSRLAAGATSTFAVSFTFQSGTHSGPLTVTFPSAFTLNSAPTGTSGCLGSFAFNNTAHTLSATKTNCTGTITLSGASITNPGTPGQYTISWVNDDPGSTIVAIVDSDTVSLNASVDPFITVNVGSQASGTACDGTFAGAGGAFALGALSTGTVTSSDASSVPHICLRVSTNASSGAVATVKSLNGILKSTAVPLDTIPSNSVTLSAGTAGYGLCVGSGGGDTGLDSTTPTGASPTAASPFNGSCAAASHAIGALTTSAQPVITLAAPTQNAFARIYLKAGISPLTKAHLDYADTLTFIVTGTF